MFSSRPATDRISVGRVSGELVLVFYIVSLALAAGLIGSHVRMLLAGLGFVPGFVASLYITLAGAAAYVALQLFMVALVRLYQPTRSPTTLTTEAVSNLASLVLLGTCFSEAIPLPSDRFRPLLPLAFLGLFAMLHAFLKLATFYAALQGARDDNRPILAWLGGGVLALMFAGAATLGWVTRIEAARGVISGDPEWTALGEEYAHAREANEGAVLSGAIPPNLAAWVFGSDRPVTIRLALIAYMRPFRSKARKKRYTRRAIACTRIDGVK